MQYKLPQVFNHLSRFLFQARNLLHLQKRLRDQNKKNLTASAEICEQRVMLSGLNFNMAPNFFADDFSIGRDIRDGDVVGTVFGLDPDIVPNLSIRFGLQSAVTPALELIDFDDGLTDGIAKQFFSPTGNTDNAFTLFDGLNAVASGTLESMRVDTDTNLDASAQLVLQFENSQGLNTQIFDEIMSATNNSGSMTISTGTFDFQGEFTGIADSEFFCGTGTSTLFDGIQFSSANFNFAAVGSDLHPSFHLFGQEDLAPFRKINLGYAGIDSVVNLPNTAERVFEYNEPITYAITGGTGQGIFGIDSVSGKITVIDESLMGEETEYTLNVTVTDTGLPQLSTTDVVTITKVGSSIAGYVNGKWWVSSPDSEDNYSTAEWANWNTGDLRKVLHGDFNGDGLTDVAAWLENGDWRVGLAQSSSKTFTFQKWTHWDTNRDIKEIHVGDFNNDGLDDIVGLIRESSSLSRKARWWVAQSQGNTFIASPYGAWGSYDGISQVVVGNFDGTNGDDLAILTPSGRWWVAQSARLIFLNGVIVPIFLTNKWTEWKVSRNPTNIRVGDFNGDGKDDIAALFGTGTYRNWWVGLSSGNSFVNTHWAKWKVSNSLDAVVVGDFDNDGKDDLAALFNQKAWWVSVSATDHFNHSRWAVWNFSSTGLSDIQVGYSNGDNFADIFARRDSNGDWKSLQSNGTSFATVTIDSWSSTANWKHVKISEFFKPQPAAPADTNSNTTPELLYQPSDISFNQTNRWQPTEDNYDLNRKYLSKSESVIIATKEKESEANEVFGSTELLDLLFSL